MPLGRAVDTSRTTPHNFLYYPPPLPHPPALSSFDPTLFWILHHSPSHPHPHPHSHPHSQSQHHVYFSTHAPRNTICSFSLPCSAVAASAVDKSKQTTRIPRMMMASETSHPIAPYGYRQRWIHQGHATKGKRLRSSMRKVSRCSGGCHTRLWRSGDGWGRVGFGSAPGNGLIRSMHDHDASAKSDDLHDDQQAAHEQQHKQHQGIPQDTQPAPGKADAKDKVQQQAQPNQYRSNRSLSSPASPSSANRFKKGATGKKQSELQDVFNRTREFIKTLNAPQSNQGQSAKASTMSDADVDIDQNPNTQQPLVDEHQSNSTSENSNNNDNYNNKDTNNNNIDPKTDTTTTNANKSYTIDQLSKMVEDRLWDEQQKPVGLEDVPVRSKSLKINFDLMHFHGRQAVIRQNYDTAIRLYQKCIQLDKEDGKAWLGLARVYLRKREVEQARNVFLQGLKFCKRNAHLSQALGVLEEKQGNYGLSKKYYIQGIRYNAKHVASWISLGLLEQRFRNKIRARECFRSAAEADPHNYYVWHAWGMLEKNSHSYDRARFYFMKGIDVNPDNAATYHVLGKLEEDLGNFEAAKKNYSLALQVNPNNTFTLVSLANLLGRRFRDVNKASVMFERAIKRRPWDGAIYQSYALLMIRMGQIDIARQLFKEGCHAAPTHSPLWQAWGIIEMECQNYELARNLFQEGIWSDPKSKDAVKIWQAWGLLEARQGNIKDARKYFRYGLELDRGSSVLLSTWAWVESTKGNTSLAELLFEDALKYDPKNPSIWRVYRRHEMRQGNYESARNISQRAEKALQFQDESQLDRNEIASRQAGDFTSLGPWVSESDLADLGNSRLETPPRPRPSTTARKKKKKSKWYLGVRRMHQRDNC